jgi:hypothetical protein
VAEGGALLRRYTGKTRIEGSNPSLSATLFIAESEEAGSASAKVVPKPVSYWRLSAIPNTVSSICLFMAFLIRIAVLR